MIEVDTSYVGYCFRAKVHFAPFGATLGTTTFTSIYHYLLKIQKNLHYTRSSVPLQNHWTPFIANNISLRANKPLTTTNWVENIVNLQNLIFMDSDMFVSHDTLWVTCWLFIFVTVIYEKQKPHYTAIVGCVYDTWNLLHVYKELLQWGWNITSEQGGN